MAHHGTDWIEQVVANNNNIIVINNTLFKTEASKIPLPPSLLPAIEAEALSLLPTCLVGCCVMKGNGNCHLIVIVIITPSPPQWRSGGEDAATILCRAVIQLLSVTTVSSPPIRLVFV